MWVWGQGCFYGGRIRGLWFPSVLPERGGLQVVCVGLQYAGVVAAEVLPVTGVADGQLVVVAELEQEVDGSVAAAHDRLLVPHHPVLSGGICRTDDGEEAELKRATSRWDLWICPRQLCPPCRL